VTSAWRAALLAPLIAPIIIALPHVGATGATDPAGPGHRRTSHRSEQPATPPPDAAATAQQLKDAETTRAVQIQAQRDAAARAQAAAAQARRLADERVAAAARLRDAETITAGAASRVAALADRERDAEARLAARARDFAPLLPLIERLSIYPAETLLAVPAPPDQTLRGILVLAGLSRQLETDAAALREEEAQARSLRAQLAAALPGFAAAQAAQAREAAALDRQIASARTTSSAAEDAASEAARRAAAEAARADGLRAAIAAIEAHRQAAEAQARQAAETATRQRRDGDAAAARERQEALARPAGPGVGTPSSGGGGTGIGQGRLTAPVAGNVIRAFGEASDAGPANGLSYQAPPSARVVSPCGGRVVFSGPFRSYGQLIIVDCGGGYHVVLAGLDRLDAGVGQQVQPGEPVGVMPAWDPRGGEHRPSLYVELREKGEPVNPAPFLRAKS
jgi:septal ring factor EnvC (AmiA/AmiB activator)